MKPGAQSRIEMSKPLTIAINAIAVQADKPIGVESFVKSVLGKSQFWPARIILCLRRGVSAHPALGKEFFDRNTVQATRHYPARYTWVRILVEMLLLSWDLRHSDIVLSVNNFGPLFGNRRQRRIVLIHDVWFMSDVFDGSPLSRFSFRFLLTLQIWRTPTIITVSEFSRREIHRHFGVDLRRIRVVENCLPKDPVSAASPSTGTQPRYFCLIGSSRRNKNIRRALEGYRRYIASGDFPVLLRVFGDFERDSIAELVKEFPDLGDHVRFEGYVERVDFERALSGSAGVVFPSLYEGYGIPAIEAIRARKPLMISQETACSDLVGDVAVVVDGKDPSSICSGYRRLETFEITEVSKRLAEIDVRCSDCEERAQELRSVVLGEEVHTPGAA